MTIEDFILQLKVKGIFESFNTVKDGQHKTAHYNLFEKKINETSYQLTANVYSNFNWSLINQLYHFADVHKINDNIFHFSRNLYSTGHKKSLLGDNFRESFDAQLPKEISFDNKVFSRKQFGYDYFYFNEELPDNVFIDLNDQFKLMKIKCTQIGGIYVPSKKGKRCFMITNGIIYAEGLQNAIHYNAIKNPSIFQLSADDIMILASLNKLLKIKNNNIRNAENFEEIKSFYVEKMTSKLLKLE